MPDDKLFENMAQSEPVAEVEELGEEDVINEPGEPEEYEPRFLANAKGSIVVLLLVIAFFILFALWGSFWSKPEIGQSPVLAPARTEKSN